MSKHVAGRELDALVEEHVMGGTMTNDFGSVSGWIYLPPRSTDIAAAWEVVEKLAAKGFDLELRTFSEGVVAEFRQYERSADEEPDGRAAIDPRDGAAPLAICLAALKAVALHPASEEPSPQSGGRR